MQKPESLRSDIRCDPAESGYLFPLENSLRCKRVPVQLSLAFVRTIFYVMYPERLEDPFDGAAKESRCVLTVLPY